VRNEYNIFFGKPEEKNQIGRPRRGWMDGWIILKCITKKKSGV
jgi:hypothetical protein